jgi:hypothetical protein
MTTGQHRAAARLAAINERNAARAAAMPPDRVTRQQRRAAERKAQTFGSRGRRGRRGFSSGKMGQRRKPRGVTGFDLSRIKNPEKFLNSHARKMAGLIKALSR